MAFDIETVIKEMGSAAGEVLSKEGPKIKACIKNAFETEKLALDAIANARIAGEITDADMKSQIADEKDALKAALLACKVKSKVMAQNAVNAALNVFTDAIKAALAAI